MSYVKGSVLFFVLAFVVSAPSRAAVSGDAHPYLTEKFFVDVGIFFPKRELRISVEGIDGITNQDIDFDDELDLSKNDETVSLNFGWRIGRHWKFSAQYFRTNDSFGATLQEDVEWGDNVFPVGGDVTGGQDFTLVRSLIGYEFNASDKHAFGIGGGLHWLEIGVFIEGDFLLGGPGGPVVNDRESVSAKGVLPNIGAWYRYSLTQKWVLTARYDWLSVAVGDYDGRLVNASAGVNYQMFDHFGVGLNYNYFELDVGVSSTDWVGTALTSYKGVFFYLSAYW
ncbi:MAG: hypothetical protein ACI88G_001952 [Woeseiaceae bacterium]|jgi:hypothetical protein